MVKLLKHPNNTDVALEVLKKYYVKEKNIYKLKIMWWNIGNCHAPWPMDIVEKLELPSEKFAEFRPYTWVKE